MSKKREKASQAEDKPFISITRSLRRGEASDGVQLAQLAVAGARLRAHSPPWPSAFRCNVQTP